MADRPLKRTVLRIRHSAHEVHLTHLGVGNGEDNIIVATCFGSWGHWAELAADFVDGRPLPACIEEALVARFGSVAILELRNF